MEIMTPHRKQDWLNQNIVKNPDKVSYNNGALHVHQEPNIQYDGQARDVPESINFTYRRDLCELSADLMFMHEAIFSVGEVVEDIPLEYKAPRMCDAVTDVDNEEEKYRRFRVSGDRVEDYLESSKQCPQT